MGEAVLQFFGCAVVIVAAGVVLTRAADNIAEVTGLGRLLVGSILLAGATSLPELLTDIAAVRLDPPAPNLAVGDLMGSSLSNLLILAVLDLVTGGRLLTRINLHHSLAATFSMVMILLAVIGLQFQSPTTIGGVGVMSWVLLGVYICGLRVVSRDQQFPADPASPAPANPAQASPAQANPDQANPDQANPDQANPDQANPDQANPDQANPDQANPDQANPDQANPDQANPDQAKTDKVVPDHVKPDPLPQSARGTDTPPAGDAAPAESHDSLQVAVAKYLAAALVLVIVAPYFAHAADELAELSGLGGSFVGTTLVAFATSLPEVVATVAALRMGQPDLAIGNVFGSNSFNMLILPAVDVFYPGSLLTVASPVHVLSGTAACLVTALALMAKLNRAERKTPLLEPSSFVMVVAIVAALVMVYFRS